MQRARQHIWVAVFAALTVASCEAPPTKSVVEENFTCLGYYSMLHDERPDVQLIGQYIAPPDHEISWLVRGRIRTLIDVYRKPSVGGFLDTRHLSAYGPQEGMPQNKTGYFLLNFKTGELLEGMTECEFYDALHARYPSGKVVSLPTDEVIKISHCMPSQG